MKIISQHKIVKLILLQDMKSIFSLYLSHLVIDHFQKRNKEAKMIQSQDV